MKKDNKIFLLISVGIYGALGWIIIGIFITMSLPNGIIILNFNKYNELYAEFFLVWITAIILLLLTMVMVILEVKK